MGKLADEVQAAFAAKPHRTITVPEWGNRELTIFPVTLAQYQKINAETDPFRRLARAIQVRAKTPDCAPLFDEADFEALVSYGVGSYGPTVIARVAQEIMNDMPDTEKTEGN